MLKNCNNTDSKAELVGFACGVLRNLVGVEEIKRFMVEEGAISAFINLMRSSNDEAIHPLNSFKTLLLEMNLLGKLWLKKEESKMRLEVAVEVAAEFGRAAVEVTREEEEKAS